MKLSIIIVNYNVTQLLRECIQSIIRHAQEISFEIIVVDNNSPDSSWRSLIEEFPKVKFIASPTNDGFSKANNKAAKEANGEYILLLNPDTLFLDNKLKEVINFADEQKKLGCIGVQLINPNGELLPECKRNLPDFFNSFEKLFVPTKTNNSKSYYRSDLPSSIISPVDIITGAFLLCKRDTYFEIGGLDESYFMYGEDIDLCYTFLQNGYNNWYYGEMKVLHYKGESTVKDETYLNRFYGAMHIFINKYYKKQSFIKYSLFYLGLKTKYFYQKMKLKTKKSNP